MLLLITNNIYLNIINVHKWVGSELTNINLKSVIKNLLFFK